MSKMYEQIVLSVLCIFSVSAFSDVLIGESSRPKDARSNESSVREVATEVTINGNRIGTLETNYSNLTEQIERVTSSNAKVLSELEKLKAVGQAGRSEPVMGALDLAFKIVAHDLVIIAIIATLLVALTIGGGASIYNTLSRSLEEKAKSLVDAQAINMRKLLKNEIQKIVKGAEHEVSVIFFTKLGLAFWNQSQQALKEGTSANGEYTRNLESAISFAKTALSSALKLDGAKLVRLYTAKNNVAFFLAARGTGNDKEQSSALAKDLRDAAFQLKDTEEGKGHWYRWLDTYCYVRTKFERADSQVETANFVQFLRAQKDISDNWKTQMLIRYEELGIVVSETRTDQ